MAVEAMSPVFTEGIGKGGGGEEPAPKGGVVGPDQGTNGEDLCILMLFSGPVVGHFVKPGVGRILEWHMNPIMAQFCLPRR